MVTCPKRLSCFNSVFGSFPNEEPKQLKSLSRKYILKVYPPFEKGKNVPPAFKTMSFGILEKRSNKNLGLIKPTDSTNQQEKPKVGWRAGAKTDGKRERIEKESKRFDDFEILWFSRRKNPPYILRRWYLIPITGRDSVSGFAPKYETGKVIDVRVTPVHENTNGHIRT